jgi:hypothetical protein
MTVEKQLRRLTELGITDFGTTKDVEELQADMLRRLARSSVDPGQYASLADCRPDFCAYKKCLEACWLGTRHHRQKEIPAIHDLLLKGCANLHSFQQKLKPASWQAHKQTPLRTSETIPVSSPAT